MGYEPIRRTLRSYLLYCFTESQRRGLRKSVGHQHVVMPPERMEGLCERNEVTRYQSCALMQQLEEGVLAVCSHFAPVHGTGWLSNLRSDKCHMFTVALHDELLQIRRKALQILFIGRDRKVLGAEDVVVPDAQQPHKYRHVVWERGCQVVHVHLVKSV